MEQQKMDETAPNVDGRRCPEADGADQLDQDDEEDVQGPAPEGLDVGAGGVGPAFVYDTAKMQRQFRRAKRSNGTMWPKDGIHRNNNVHCANGMMLSKSLPDTSGYGLLSQHVKSLFGMRKNSRKPRSAPKKNRGMPRKGGAGGKGAWGKPGSELDESGVCQDFRDPNYDSDSQEEYKLEEVEPMLSDGELQKVIEPILLEYLEIGNSDEVEVLLSELALGPNVYKVAKMAMMLALERHNPQRELISRLISDLYGPILDQKDIAKAFDELLDGLDDIVLDTPEANVLLGQFIARCVADDCLPPKFITSYKGRVEKESVKSALEKADVLLSMNHGIAHLDNIWGMGGGNRPVKYLTNKIVELLKEYIHSGDDAEAMRCLLELEVPHFHHEFVYQTGYLSIEDSTERVRDVMVQLLKFLTSALVITTTELEKGLKRLFKDMQDISLDVPAGYVLLDQFVTKLHAEGVVNDDLLKLLPTRGRKRFVSEGDGGRLKPTVF